LYQQGLRVSQGRNQLGLVFNLEEGALCSCETWFDVMSQNCSNGKASELGFTFSTKQLILHVTPKLLTCKLFVLFVFVV
jgi:hypothetical protein